MLIGFLMLDDFRVGELSLRLCNCCSNNASLLLADVGVSSVGGGVAVDDMVVVAVSSVVDGVTVEEDVVVEGWYGD